MNQIKSQNAGTFSINRIFAKKMNYNNVTAPPRREEKIKKQPCIQQAQEGGC